MKKVYNFIIIHGIGNAQKGYSKMFERNIRKLCNSWAELKFYEVLWADKILEGENELQLQAKKLKLSAMKLREWFIIHVSDLVAYLRDEEISKEIKNDLRKVLNDLLPIHNKNVNIIVCHSLGSVIAYDVLKSYQQHGLETDYLFTLGSPLAMFVNDFRKEKTYFDPVSVKKGWLNIFSPYDIIAYPLQDIDSEWNVNIVQDQIISFGSFFKKFSPFIHSEYLNNKKVAKYIVNFIKTKEEEK